MKPRTASRLAWSIGTFSIALMVGQLVLMFFDRHAALPAAVSGGRWNFSNVLSAAVNIAVPTIGIVLASRRPENTIGWLFVAAGFTLGLSAFGVSYGAHALVASPGSLPAGRLFAWVGSWVGLIPLGVLLFLFLLFPTGHLRSPRWRPVARFVGGAFALLTATALISSTEAWNHPYSQSFSFGLLGLLFLVLLIAALVLALAAVVVRFRGSAGEERLQLKWFATAAALLVATFIASFFSNSSSPPPVVSVLQSIAFVFLYTAIGIAVLKYRLYEIDVVISRAVVYGTLAVFITLVYVGLVVGVGALVGHRGSPLLSAIAAGVIAVAFQPVRQRAGRLANRVVYGERATPYEVLSDFAGRIAGTYSSEGHCCIGRGRASLGRLVPMRSRAHPSPHIPPRSAFAGYRFPPEVITLAVRWYLRFGLSYRDVEELLAERGIVVDHVTVYRWVQHFAPEFAEAARARRHVVGDRWHVDETYLKIGGTWRYLFRAIDQFGQVIDVYLSPRRNGEAARRFFAQAIDRTRISPVEVTTDRYRLYPRVLDEMLPAAFHDTEVHSNNPIETDHGRLKAWLRPMRGLKRDRTAGVIVAGHAFIQNLRRGFYNLGTDVPSAARLTDAFAELALVM